MHVVRKRLLYFGALLLMFIALSATQSAQGPVDDARFGQMFRSESARVGQMKIHYMDGGSGDAVVLLHGWPQTWFEWRELMPDLAQRYRVIAPDLPGLGESDGLPPYDKKTLAQHIHTLVGDRYKPSAFENQRRYTLDSNTTARLREMRWTTPIMKAPEVDNAGASPLGGESPVSTST
jgi:hypothetical protein